MMRQYLTLLMILAIFGFGAPFLAADGIQLQSPTNLDESAAPVTSPPLRLQAPVLRIALRYDAEKDAPQFVLPPNNAPAPIAPLTEAEQRAAEEEPMLKLVPMNSQSGEIGTGVAPTMKGEPQKLEKISEPMEIPPVEMQAELPSESAPSKQLAPVAEAAPVEKTPEAPPQKQLTPDQTRLRAKIRRVLDYYYRQPIDVAKENAWATMHAMLPYGVDAHVRTGGRENRSVNAIGWLCWNGKCKGYNLFYVEDGRLGARQGPNVQGHHGQFLAMLAQSFVPPSYEIRVSDDRFQLTDLIEFEQQTCRPASELTFKLISLAYYLPVDAEWKSDDGQNWNIERLIEEELRQPVIGAACGGTHRLMGFSYAVRKRELSGEPMSGHWGRAKTFLDDYHAYTFRLQNPDGSFSTDWFEGRGAQPDLQRRLQTTGHIAEWLAYSLSEEQLSSPKMVKAIEYLTTILEKNPRMDWSIGPLGHGLHALAIYDQRVFDTPPGHRSADIATKLP